MIGTTVNVSSTTLTVAFPLAIAEKTKSSLSISVADNSYVKVSSSNTVWFNISSKIGASFSPFTVTVTSSLSVNLLIWSSTVILIVASPFKLVTGVSSNNFIRSSSVSVIKHWSKTPPISSIISPICCAKI